MISLCGQLGLCSSTWSAVRSLFTEWSRLKVLILYTGSELSWPQTKEQSWSLVCHPLLHQVWSCNYLLVLRWSTSTCSPEKIENYSKPPKNCLVFWSHLVKLLLIFCPECMVPLVSLVFSDQFLLSCNFSLLVSWSLCLMSFCKRVTVLDQVFLSLLLPISARLSCGNLSHPLLLELIKALSSRALSLLSSTSCWLNQILCTVSIRLSKGRTRLILVTYWPPF